MASVPVKAASAKKETSGTRFRGCLSCFGCGCMLPLALLAALCVAAIFFLPQFSDGSGRPSNLPKPVEITREDRWSLQDKLATARTQPDPVTLHLTLPEMNALLSRLDLKPAAGFAFTRSWSYLTPGTLSFVLEGSGFWMRKLSIVVQLETSPEGCRVAGMLFNEHRLPERVVRLIGIPWLNRWLKDSAGLDMRFDGQMAYQVTLASDVITLVGAFPWLRTSHEGEGQ